MFIGRKQELAYLNELYESGRFELAVLYGRRCVGKTELINRFLEGKRAVYFSGTDSNAKYALESFGKAVTGFTDKKRGLPPTEEAEKPGVDGAGLEADGSGFSLDGIVFDGGGTAATSSREFVVNDADFAADGRVFSLDTVKAMAEDTGAEENILAEKLWNGADGFADEEEEGEAEGEAFGGDGATAFGSFQEVFDAVERLAEKDRLVLVLDELPRLLRASKEVLPSLKRLADKGILGLMVILCGASGSTMEEYVLSEKAPLYKSQTARIELQPFDFAETCRYLEGFSGGDAAVLYGIVGGIPKYLAWMDDELGVGENIKNLFLDSSSPLFEEPERLLRQEVREPGLYNALLIAIATGASRMSEISERVGEDTCVCATYLKTLLALGIVRKETPYGEKTTRKSVYTIGDNLFRFWYRFVPEHASLIARGEADLVYERIEPYLPEFMEKVYEDICRQQLLKQRESGKAPVEFKALGRWWGTDPLTHEPARIDIMGVQDKETALFGACDWSPEKMSVGILEELMRKSHIFKYKNTQFYLFSKSGFTKECVDAAAKRGNVMLVQCRF